MLHDCASEDFFLYCDIADFARVQSRAAVRANTSLSPDFYKRLIALLKSLGDTNSLENGAIDRSESDIVIGKSEVYDAQSLVVVLVSRWLHNAVNGRLVVATGQELHHVAGVDDQTVLDVTDPSPFAVGGEHLESRYRLAPQESNTSEI